MFFVWLQDVKASAPWEATHAYNKGSPRNHSNSRFAFLKPFSLLLFLICQFICLVAVCVFNFAWCEFMLETLRTMFDLSVGGVTKCFLCKFVGFYHP